LSCAEARAKQILPQIAGSLYPSSDFHTSENLRDMDPSVLSFARPGTSTESLPSPLEATLLDNLPTPGVSAASTSAEVVTSQAVTSLDISASDSSLEQGSTVPSPRLLRPRQRTDSVMTFNAGGAESIFRLLPRETRSALRRMLFVEPSSRCTFTDLLKGRGKASGLLCGCKVDPHSGRRTPASSSSGLETPPGGHCVDHDDCDPEDEDDGDEWLKNIKSCSQSGAEPCHVHIKVPVDEKQGRKKFFH